MTLSITHEGSDLPPIVQRAISRVMNPVLDLTPAERTALAALVARAEARDGQAAFWVRRLNFAEMFGRVERTVSNWLAALEAKGWIEKEQGRTRWGNFKSLTLHFTAAAVCYLGIARGADLSTTYRKKTASRYEGGNQALTQSLQRQPVGDSEKIGSRRSAEDRVPLDCKPLTQLGLRPSAIFRLMGLATKHGKRLGDVVAARLDAIKKARNPYCLAHALASDGVDYAAVLRVTAERVQEQQQVIEQVQQISRLQTDYTGSTIEGAGQGERVYIENGVPLEMRLQGSRWVTVGAIAGERQTRFWAWVERTRPRRLAMESKES